MIRIYLDEVFELGQEITIPQDEWHYLVSVRRNQGPVEAFNRRGQVASGSCKNKKFKIEVVSQSNIPLYPVVIALAVPDREALSSSIRAASELGIEKLVLFSGDRSQSAKNLEKSFEKLKKLAVESMRQCARPEHGQSCRLRFRPPRIQISRRSARRI
jgi:RsmE family RNA methyltransferase